MRGIKRRNGDGYRHQRRHRRRCRRRRSHNNSFF